MTAIESCWKGAIEKGLFVMWRVDGKEYKTSKKHSGTKGYPKIWQVICKMI